MKTAHLLLFMTLLPLLAAEPKGIPEFKEEIRRIILAEDQRAFRGLHDWSEIEEKKVQNFMLLWALNFAHDTRNEGHKIDSIEWVSADELPKIDCMTSEAVQGMITVSGATYIEGEKKFPYTYNFHTTLDEKSKWKLIACDDPSPLLGNKNQ